MDTVLKLRKELQFLMYNLDDENVPGLNSIVEDVSGNYSLIQQNATSISSLVSDVDDNYSLIQQNASDITLKVSTSEYTASVIVSKINGGTVTINASKIDLTGITRIYDANDVTRYAEFIGYDFLLGSPASFGGGIYYTSYVYLSNPTDLYTLNINAYRSSLDTGSINITTKTLDLSNVGSITWGSNSPTAVFG
jgi:hypothetical protein